MKEKTAEEIVLEIKDKSELMVDLAYSSILYDNKTIAKEVYDLENAVDSLYQTLQRKSLEDVQNGKHSINDALTFLRIAHAGEQIADAAQEIADVELRDVELHPILKMSIREADVVFTKVEVKNKNTKIDPDDILFAKGPEDGEKHLIDLAAGTSNEI